MLRKTMSVSSAGLVPYRNKEERATKYAKQTRNAARALVAQQAVDLQLQRDQAEGVRQLNTQAEARRFEAAHQSHRPRPSLRVALPPAGTKILRVR